MLFNKNTCPFIKEFSFKLIRTGKQTMKALSIMSKCSTTLGSHNGKGISIRKMQLGFRKMLHSEHFYFECHGHHFSNIISLRIFPKLNQDQLISHEPWSTFIFVQHFFVSLFFQWQKLSSPIDIILISSL